MPFYSRRQFLQTGVATVATSSCFRSQTLFASPFGLPIGLQLYSVREMLPKDYDGTLKKIASLGYQEVEAAGFYHHTAQQVKDAMASAGLNCVSAHYPYTELHTGLDSIIEFHHTLGAHYIICSFPGYKNPASVASTSAGERRPFTLEDWRWNADQFNGFGKRVSAAGLQFGYHNHTMEFTPQDGVVPFDELLRLTDPGLVTFEMDCGWVKVGGADPAAYLRKFPDRISMLHVKDFKRVDRPASIADPPPSAELGQGSSDYREVFAAAKPGEIKHYFVEQEEFDMPPFEALKIDADYMKKLTV